tara:strand:- start:196 stop:522 length:327 start_codon:yes stop_codon:yes gene_type:complete
MANINLDYDLNISIQKGDTLYASKLTGDTKPKILGEVDSINHGDNQITYTPISGAPSLTSNHYLMFAKNKLVNYSGITGYYAETEYRNYSTLPAEMFATAVDYSESSK